MKITLRKANALQAAINEALKELDLSTEVTINEFEKPEEVLESARLRFNFSFEKRKSLLDALYEIRRNVANANSQSGINDVLAQVARLEADIKVHYHKSNTPEKTALNVLEGKLSKIRDRTESSDYYRMRDDEVRSTFFCEEDVDFFKESTKRMKKEKQSLQDKLLELNVRTEIMLSDDTVGILEDEGIV